MDYYDKRAVQSEKFWTSTKKSGIFAVVLQPKKNTKNADWKKLLRKSRQTEPYDKKTPQREVFSSLRSKTKCC